MQTTSPLARVVPPEEAGFTRAGLERIDEHLRTRYVRAGKLAGCLTLVARRGKVAFLSALGLMDRERDKPMQADTIFRIYSMTKPVTTVGMMTLFERGAFQLSDPVHKWIPAWEHLRVYRFGRHPRFTTIPATRPMTVRDLLTHTSGLTYTITERSSVDSAYRKLGIANGKGTLKDMIAALSELPLEFSPGTHWGYSVATDVVGHLIEVLGDRPLDDYLHDNVLGPLGMSDTSFFVPKDKVDRFAANYSPSTETPLMLVDDPVQSGFARPVTFLSGGAGLVSTAPDYLRFAEMLRRGGELDGVRILGPRTVQFMRQNHLPEGQDLAACAMASSFSETRYDGVGFGLGFYVTLDPVRAQVPGSPGEYGWGGMASTAFFIDPVEDLVVIFMTQLLPSSTYNLRAELKSLVYSALL
jgi:CubicO group peptidase (beta-lactamase class C family)